ncbi:hypothetical protein XPA_009919 [Xanthoria parietina]
MLPLSEVGRNPTMTTSERGLLGQRPPGPSGTRGGVMIAHGSATMCKLGKAGIDVGAGGSRFCRAQSLRENGQIPSMMVMRSSGYQ